MRLNTAPKARVFSACRILLRILLPASALLLMTAAPVMATQGHGHPEGLYAHQMAHVFFAFSMGLLIYWLRKRGLTADAGWRYIQYASFFFILWNADAFLVHFIEEQTTVLEITRVNFWQIRLQPQPGYEWIDTVYYLAKLDHLLCVPALLCLFIGLKRLYAGSAGLEGEIRT
jgi:hypothetical protein